MPSFTLGLQQFAAKTERELSQIVRKTCLSIGRRIIMRTPVRTGMARGNWQTTIGYPATGTLERSDPGGARAAAELTSKTLQWRPTDGGSFFFANNLPYIGRLENGSSKQSPAGMVAVTMAEFGGIVDDASWGGAADTGGTSWDIGGAGE